MIKVHCGCSETETLTLAASIVQASDEDLKMVVFLSDALSLLQAYRNYKLPTLAKALQHVAAVYSGLQPTLEYQKVSKQTSLQRKAPEENSMSASAKRRPSSERS